MIISVPSSWNFAHNSALSRWQLTVDKTSSSSSTKLDELSGLLATTSKASEASVTAVSPSSSKTPLLLLLLWSSRVVKSPTLLCKIIFTVCCLYAKVLKNCNNPVPSLRGLKIFYNFSKFFEVWVLVLLLFCFFEFSFYFSVYENRKCIFRLNISFKICQSFPCEQVKACCFRSHKVCNREWPNSVSWRAPHKIFLSFNQGNTLLC